MKITKEISERNSEKELTDRLSILIASGAGVVHIRSQDVIHTAQSLRKYFILGSGDVYKEWDIATGLKTVDHSNMYDVLPSGGVKGPVDAVIQEALDPSVGDVLGADTCSVYNIINPQSWIESSPGLAYLIEAANNILVSRPVTIILLTEDEALPGSLADKVISVRVEPPGHDELLESIHEVLDTAASDGLVEELSKEDMDTLGYAGAGMTAASFENYTSIAISDRSFHQKKAGPRDLIEGIAKGKTEIVNKNELLQLYHPESMEDVGGMDVLKSWIRKRANCYSDEAADFGITPPKGIVVVGVPGSGKSLVAKSIASVLGVPAIRLDFGRVFNSYVGKSEEQIRTALRMVESMAPAILVCDEIDKGLGGIGGSGGDSGTSSRVLGTFLTWLQDNTSPIFTMVTANNIDGLPPELTRRGRFDAIFSSSLPNPTEREQVLDIHLRKRGWSMDDIGENGVASIVEASKGYVPAEIESAIEDALINAFDEGVDLEARHIVSSLKDMVPLSVSYKDKIDSMVAWAENNATAASSPYIAPKPDKGKPKVRNIRSRKKADKGEHSVH